jgi:DUF1680 family protein
MIKAFLNPVLLAMLPFLAMAQAVDRLHPPVFSDVEIRGRIGQAMDSCIQNGVMAVDPGLYTLPFKNKTDQGGSFRGEFWGKWFTSAALAAAYRSHKPYLDLLGTTVKDLMDAQEEDGRLSSYPREEDFLNWDIWGRKYALLGLLSYYDLTGDRAALNAASRSVDALISIAGEGRQKLTETGLQVLGSMSSTSILEPVVLLYLRTGEQKYLDFARYMVSLLSEPNSYTDRGMRLVEDALAGIPPVRISAPKAYEAMSCYEGLCELYRATGDSLYMNAALAYAGGLLDREIMVVGSGSSAELWCDGAFRQTELLEQPMETCVTATWMKFCYQLLRLTGDPLWADQLELSLYNALLGAMNRSGDWWAYFSPLAGERMPSPMQVPQCQSSCCVANGPRALLLTPGWAVMYGGEGPVVNLFTPGKWELKTPGGEDLEIVQETSYPAGEKIEIRLHLEQPESYTLSLRIPAWSRQHKVLVNDRPVPAARGEYARIWREWNDGDRIRVVLDMRGRVLASPGSRNDLAVMRGPIVLALDNRLVKEAPYNLWLYPEGTAWTHADDFGGLDYVLPDTTGSAGAEATIELTPAASKPDGVWMAFEVPFLYRYTHFFDHEVRGLHMCDYASAGNGYSTGNLFRVWIPQPLFMQEIFPGNTWKILYPGEERPVFPGNIWDGNKNR